MIKKKSTSQSAFFYWRVSIGLLLGLAGVSLALLGISQFSAHAQPRTSTINFGPELVPPLFDCSQFNALGLDKQENFRAGAIAIYCGRAQGGAPTDAEGNPLSIAQQVLAPLSGGADFDVIFPGPETGSHITQSETFVGSNPNDPNTIVVAYNDSRGVFTSPINISGASVSTDGGATFLRLTKTNGQSPFSNTLGDPVELFNVPTSTWFSIFLDPACGGQGIGAYKSTNPVDPNSWTHSCIHTGSGDDRESGATDQNPASPFFGRMYVSWNNFSDGGSLRVRFSTDNGVTWPTERTLAGAFPFIRDVQITVDSGNGNVYVAGMDEGGGGLTNRPNKFYKSTDGGNSWSLVFTGTSFPGPGRTTCPNTYFACMFGTSSSNGVWRHMGWGQPAAQNDNVHYVYASRNTSNGDPGNVFYIRSTNGGSTFSTPFQLNTDTTTKGQWQPNITLAADGSLLAMWYDESPATQTCVNGSTSVLCYQMFTRKSTDGGATWLPSEAFSDVVSPLPAQPDPGIIGEYRGDYDYGYPLLNAHLRAWVDGRVAVNSQSQQDVFFDQEGGGGGGIPCADLVSFKVRCISSTRGDKLQAKLTLTDTSHSGEQVTISVDGNPITVTINGNKATLQISNEGAGTHTVELTDPAGCFPPQMPTCP